MSKKYYIIGGAVLFLIIIIIVLLLSAKAKPTGPTGNIELTWWKTFETSDNVQQLITDYQNTHKNVTINYVKKDISTYEQDLLNAYASDTGPDILSIHNDWLPAQIDKLAPMPAGSVRDYKTNFVDVATNDFIKENKIYALPMNVDVLAMYYNRDILNSAGVAPPATWEELAKVTVPKITKQDQPGNFTRSGIALGTSANVNRAVDIISLLMLQNGTQFYNPDYSQATFDQQQLPSNQSGTTCETLGCLTLEYYTQFANPAKNVYTWNAKSDNSVDAFTQGKLAMMLSYYYMRPQILDKGPTLNWDVAPVPQVSQDSIKVNFANYWGEAVNKNSKNAAAAWDFLNFITSKDELSKYYTQHKQVSSRKDILQIQAQDSEIGVYAEAALSAKSVYKKDADRFEKTFSDMISDVSTKGLSANEAISNAVQQIDLQLQQNF
jgi:multiple sugar transport system substrate-binding protein